MDAGGTEGTGAGAGLPPDPKGDTDGRVGGDAPPRLPDPDLVGAFAAPSSDARGSEAMMATPVLPHAEARPPAPMISHAPVAGASTWYRTDQQRYKSVYRRANPWYRRVGRGLVGLSVFAVVAAALYFGAQAGQDYLQRDKLPKPGQDAPAFASTSFLVNSSAPAPELDGTVTIDTGSGAFEFVGSGTEPQTGVAGPQAGVEIVSPDGTRMYVRRDGGGWRNADASDPDVEALTRAIPYLLAVNDPDDVLENRLRKGYVELIDETTEGVDPDSRERYEMALDTADYSSDYPLQWENFQDAVIPGVAESGAVPLTMWTDNDHVVVRLRDEASNWAWERLTYSLERFAPIDPSGAVAPQPPATTPPTTAPAG